MKYGKAIGEFLLPFKSEDFSVLYHKSREIAQRLGLNVAVTKQKRNWPKYGKDGYVVEVVFTPTEWKEGVTRDPKTHNRLKVFSHDTPYIKAEVEFNDSRIEGTDHRVNQYHCFIGTHNLFECEYKCRHYEAFSKYQSFEYDTEINEIMSFIGCEVAKIYQAYHLLFWV